MSDTPAFAFDGVTKRYRDFLLRQRVTALRDFSIDVKAGEMVGLLGPNGSGKSTILKLASGLIAPSEGSVRLRGHDPRQAKARAGLGYLPEENANYPFLTATQSVMLHLRLAGVARKEARSKAAELLERVGMTHAASRRCAGFSKGMSRRVGLAQCLAASPRLLILDEPTSGLDPIAVELVRDLIMDLKKQGVSMLVSSHLMAEIDDLCDRVVVLSQGSVLRSGTLSDLLGQPGHYRASFEAKGSAEAAQKALCEGKAEKLRVTPKLKTLADFYRDVVGKANDMPSVKSDSEKSG